MRPSTGAVLACCVALFALVNRSQGEIGDAVYRDQLEVAGLSVNWHTALTYRYDNGAKTRYVVQADSDIVRVNDNWTAFLGTTGGTFQKQACPANLSLGMRQLALQYATAQAGTAYWNYYYALAMGYFIGNPLGAYEDPTWITSGMGFRCDGLVEWVYEQIGYNPCVDAHLYNDYGFAVVDWYACGPYYQSTQIPQAIQTPPSGVAMTYPSSTDRNNPTISSSNSITLQAIASDSQSGLSFNEPFDYYYSKYVNGEWTGWVFYGSNSGTQPVTILSANTLYSWYVVAFDNDSDQTLSSFYYFKWVPGYTISASAGSGGSISPNGTFTKNAGDNQAFTASPSANYVVNQWLVDSGVVQTGGTSYTLYNIQAGHTVQVTFTYVPPHTRSRLRRVVVGLLARTAVLQRTPGTTRRSRVPSANTW